MYSFQKKRFFSYCILPTENRTPGLCKSPVGSWAEQRQMNGHRAFSSRVLQLNTIQTCFKTTWHLKELSKHHPPTDFPRIAPPQLQTIELASFFMKIQSNTSHKAQTNYRSHHSILFEVTGISQQCTAILSYSCQDGRQIDSSKPLAGIQSTLDFLHDSRGLLSPEAAVFPLKLVATEALGQVKRIGDEI